MHSTLIRINNYNILLSNTATTSYLTNKYYNYNILQSSTTTTSYLNNKYYRLATEEQLGPTELRRDGEKEEEEEDYMDIIKSGKRADKAEKVAMERVREYQINRLKYYYAVAEFDSEESANRSATCLIEHDNMHIFEF